MTATTERQPPFRINGWVMVALMLVPVLAYGAYEHVTSPQYPLHGAKAAEYLRKHPRTPDSITSARCRAGACEITFTATETNNLHGAYSELSMDAYLQSGIGAPEEVVAPIHLWTFNLVTRSGTLTATCTTSQAQHLNDGASMTRAILNRWCQTSWRPLGA